MSGGLWRLLRPLLFQLDPEIAHAASLRALQGAAATGVGAELLRSIFAHRDVTPVEAFGLSFSHAVGLAAGYDKDALAWRGLAALGFSHIEVGTVTPRPQAGNPRPRVFRLAEDRAVINRLGFPSRGMEFVARQLKGPRPDGVVIGVNIGKNKETPLSEAVKDYLAVMTRLYDLADYVAVNVSSPNTPGLRDLQRFDYLGDLLGALAAARDQLSTSKERRVPLLVKLAPDLDDNEVSQSVEAIKSAGIDGVIATNTTICRDGLRSSFADQSGGLSGAPLTVRSTSRLRAICGALGPKIDVIGVGGIMGPADAAEKLRAGAKLVQVYTGMVYAGPAFATRVASQLPRLLAAPAR